jgi:hypothetical protein
VRAEEDRVFDRGLLLTRQAIRRQLAAMPHELYLVRLIHYATKRPFPGERLWTADQLTHLATIRFLRRRNQEGCDIYLHPYAQDHNAGYILVDLDHAGPAVIAAMSAQGHEPCVVLQTSPGHLQAWVQVSRDPLRPALATAIGIQLARTYGGDCASTDWRHLGRLAGFTNQKPQRRSAQGYAPWVKVLHSRPGLARHAPQLLQSARAPLDQPPATPCAEPPLDGQPSAPGEITAAQATAIYQTWVRRWHIAERFVPPDWSIVDLWVARALFARAWPAARVQAVLRLGSPLFPRRHPHPEDYLRRTLARAFSSPGPALCVLPDSAPAPPPLAARDPLASSHSLASSRR